MGARVRKDLRRSSLKANVRASLWIPPMYACMYVGKKHKNYHLYLTRTSSVLDLGVGFCSLPFMSSIDIELRSRRVIVLVPLFQA